MRKYNKAWLLIAGFTSLMACDKKINLDFGDRRNIPSHFLLQLVLNENKDTVRRFSYDAAGRPTQLSIYGNDVYKFNYTGNNRQPDSINDIKCTWQQQRLLSASSVMVTARIEYKADTITIYQQRKRLIPALPVFKDTLTLWRKSNGSIGYTALLPAATARDYTTDNNPQPYVNNQPHILPVLLQYPLADVWTDIVSLYSEHNVIRYTQYPISGTAAAPGAVRLVDFSYRFDQPQFDVPTSCEEYGTTKNKSYFVYTNSVKQ